MKNIPLFYKLLAIVSLMILLTSLLLQRQALEKMDKMGMESLIELATSNAVSLTPSAEFGLTFGNFQVTESQAEKILAEMAVAAVIVFDGHGKSVLKRINPEYEQDAAVFDQHMAEGSGYFFVPGNNKRAGLLIADRAVLTQKVLPAEELVLYDDGSTMLGEGERIGLVRVCISLNEHRKRLAIVRRISWMWTTISVLIGTLLAGFLTSYITRPLQALAEGTRRVAAGDFDFFIQTGSRDEVGQLAHAFSQMAKSLKQTTVSKEYNEKIIDAVADALFVVDSQGKILQVNQTALTMTGFSKSELMDRSLGTILADSASGGAPIFDASLAQKSAEAMIMVKDGPGVPVLFAQSHIQEEGGREHGFVIISKDITERKSFEEDLVAARNAAEQANAAKSMFLANMSHEIRTPLNAILGMAQLLHPYLSDPIGKECVDTILSSGRVLTNLINDILDLTKVQTEGIALQKIEFDLEHEVAQIARLMAGRAQQKGVEFVTCIDPDIPAELVGDPYRLSQILTNLLGNAVKFTHEGEVVLRLVLMGRSAAGVELQFEISDSGIGIDEEHLAKLFQPFFQIDGSTTRRYEGTGLGLAITLSLVQKMGGKIDVSSRQGKGSTFRFLLTFAESDVQPRTNPLQGRRFAVVSSRASVVDMVCLALAGTEVRAGVLAEAQSGGLRTFLQANQHGLDALLVDWGNGPADAALFLADLDDILGPVRLPLVFLTYLDSPPPALSFPQERVWASCVKPVFRPNLVKVLEELVAKYPAASEPAPGLEQGEELFLQPMETDTVRILAVEDNPTNQLVIRKFCKRLGHAIDLAANGEEAVEMLAKTPYRLVLMDIQMPKMDGIETTQYVRTREGPNRDVPIVAVTANAFKDDRERYFEAGMNGFLTKPLHLNQLKQVLDTYL